MLQVPSNNEYNSTSSVLKIEAEYFCFFIVFRALATNQFQLILSATIKIHDACRHPKNITNSLLWALTDTKTRKIFQITITHNKHTHTQRTGKRVNLLCTRKQMYQYIVYVCIHRCSFGSKSRIFLTQFTRRAARMKSRWKPKEKQQQKVRPTFGLIPILISGNMIYGSLFFSLLRIILVFFFVLVVRF